MKIGQPIAGANRARRIQLATGLSEDVEGAPARPPTRKSPSKGERRAWPTSLPMKTESSGTEAASTSITLFDFSSIKLVTIIVASSTVIMKTM